MDRPFAAYSGDEPYVFVSYAHRDSDAVYPELTWLNDHEIKIWYDEGIEAGTEWREEIALAIQNARLFLYFISPSSVASEHCKKEVNFALEQRIPVIAIHIQETQLPAGLSMSLSDRQAILKYQLPAAEYEEKLLARIASCLEQTIVQKPRSSKRFKTALIVSAVITITLVVMSLVFLDWAQFKPLGTDETAGVEAAIPESVQLSREELAKIRYSIAVLPFSLSNSDEETESFAKGLSEAILDNLVQSGYLRVASRSVSAQALASGDDLKSIADQLKVAYLLEGRVGRSGDNLRISVQLTRASDGVSVWSKIYDREYTEGYSTTSSLAQNIYYVAADRLDFDIYSTHGAREYPQFQDVEPEAVKYLMDADLQERLIRLGEGGSLELAERYLRMAVEVDPVFQQAWAAIANLYINRREGTMSYAEAAPLAHAAIDKLKEMNPDHPQLPLQAAQLYLNIDLNYERAQSIFNQCLQAYPQAPWCHFFLGLIDLREDRVAEALSKFTAAAGNKLGAEQNILLTNMAWLLLVIGDYEESIKVSTRARESAVGGAAQSFTIQMQSLALLLLGETEQARTFIAQAWQVDNRARPELFIYLYAMTGDEEKARQILGDKRHELNNATWLAASHLALGDADRSFEFIKAAIENRDGRMADALRRSAIFDAIRPDPRYREMVALLEATETHTQQYLATQKSIDQ